MALYTSEYLKNLSKNIPIDIKNKILTEQWKTHSSFDIFLCHSFLDRDEIQGIYIELTLLKYSVYVDWIIDPHLDRNNVTKDAAELIRKRLKSSKTLLLAISTNADLSKWMPWELGIVDGNTSSRCGIIPVSKAHVAPKGFERREFLTLYPYIEKVQNLGDKEKLLMVESASTYVELSDWIKNNKQPLYQPHNMLKS